MQYILILNLRPTGLQSFGRASPKEKDFEPSPLGEDVLAPLPICASLTIS